MKCLKWNLVKSGLVAVMLLTGCGYSLAATPLQLVEEVTAPAGNYGTAQVAPNSSVITSEPSIWQEQVLFSSTLRPEDTPYPSFLLQEAHVAETLQSRVAQPIIDVLVTSMLAIFKKSGLVFGKYVCGNEVYAAYIQGAIGLAGVYLGVSKGSSHASVGHSIAESSIQSLGALKNSMELIQSQAEQALEEVDADTSFEAQSLFFSSPTSYRAVQQMEAVQEGIEQAAGYKDLLKRHLPKLGLLSHLLTTGSTAVTRAQEWLYALGFVGDRVQLLDDDGVIEELADIHFIIPSSSKSGYLPFSGDIDKAGMDSAFASGRFDKQLEWRSLNLPHIEMTPRENVDFSRVNDHGNPYLAAIKRLVSLIPEQHTLYLFPETDSYSSQLMLDIGLVKMDESGESVSEGRWITINGQWGTKTEAEWLTERLRRNAIVKNSLRPVFHDYLWGDGRDSLPLLNPLSSDMLQNIASALDDHLQTGSETHSLSKSLEPAVIKQSGHFLAAVGAEGAVLYVDKFASQEAESPRLLLKIAEIDEVSEEVLETLEQERIKRYPVVLKGGKPFDLARWQMERMVFRIVLGEIVGHYADAATRVSLGMEKQQYPGVLGSLNHVKPQVSSKTGHKAQNNRPESAVASLLPAS